MATINEMMARLVDLFGPQAAADPTKLYGNLMVSPGGNILIGQTSDDGAHKLQVNGAGLITNGLRISGGNGIVFPDASTQYSAAMGRNRTVNGSMFSSLIAGPVTAGNGVNTYGGIDRYACSNNGATGAFNQSAGSFVYNGITRPAVTQTVTTAASSFASSSWWSGVGHLYETYSVYDLVNTPMAISFLFNTNVTGTYAVSIRSYGGAQSYTTTFSAVANTPMFVGVSIPAYSSLAIALNANVGLYLQIGAIAGTGLQATGINAWYNNGPVTAAGVTNWAATVGNFIQVAELQLESGSVWTPFERRLPAHEVMLVSRFVEQLVNQYGTGGVNGTTIAYIPLKWQQKRAVPSAILMPAASTFTCWTATTGNIQPSALTVSPATNSGLATATISGGVGGQACILENNSGSYMTVVAEF